VGHHQEAPLWGQERLRKADYRSDEADDIILYHHERCNGNGYPFGKTGGEIPLYARICAIADTFESLTAHRPFKSARSPFEALKIMRSEMASEFDPTCSGPSSCSSGRADRGLSFSRLNALS
jgi:HD-GYP domain-containing protein (c-di-GMP phosphodiesterase class II)